MVAVAGRRAVKHSCLVGRHIMAAVGAAAEVCTQGIFFPGASAERDKGGAAIF